MKWFWSWLVIILLAGLVSAQAPPPGLPGPGSTVSGEVTPLPTISTCSDTFCPCVLGETDNGFLTGNHNFPNFINFISNPLQNIDPRAVTAIYPLFGSAWVDTVPALPDGNLQVFGPALTVALSDRLAVGMNQGGYAISNFSRDEGGRIRNHPRLAALLAARRQRLLDIANGGDRSGWLNLGGFAQYTLIADVANQFLLTVGTRLEVPCGSREIFQGYGPAELSPYLTFGKEWGEFHLLGTVGYQFPIGSGSNNERFFYANFHLDRRLFGWLYPLVEVNCLHHTKNVSFDLPTRRGFIDFGTFSATGNTVSLAVGANAVLIPERLELGAVYTTVVAHQHDVDVDGVLVKMVLRY